VAGDEWQWQQRGHPAPVPAATVEVGASLADALAGYLAREGPGVVVLDEGAYRGVLTGPQLLSAARRTTQ
ncbi:MAG TPA: hypothetical protein VH274_01135, partial [Mycobacteriales bacterium]|nr:hypothetical protein [Mycobacteriales bacterium]